MRGIYSFVLSLAGLSAVLAAGCSSSPAGSSAVPGALPPPTLEARAKDLIYVADNQLNSITLYAENAKHPKPIGQITDSIAEPTRLFVDSKRSLYVLNESVSPNFPDIAIYPLGAMSPSAVISSGLAAPQGLTVSSKGRIYVANGLNQTVVEYAPGAMAPSVTLHIQNATPADLVLDSKDNLYVAYIGGPSSASGVMEFQKGSKTGKDLGIRVGSAEGIQIDNSDDVVLADYTSESIGIYPQGQSKAAQVIAIANGHPLELSFDPSRKKLFASVNEGSTYGVDEISDFPNGAPKVQIASTSSRAWPLAVSPDSVP